MNTMVTSDFKPEVDIQPFRAFAMHPAIIGTVRLLWTWLWGRYHVPQNLFLVNKWFEKLTALLRIQLRTNLYFRFFIFRKLTELCRFVTYL